MGLSAKEIRAVCEGSFLPAMNAALQQVFRAADAAVTQLAVAAASNADQNRYFEAVQGLRIVRPELIEHFSRRLLLPLACEPVPDWPVEAAHVDSLRSLLSINLELWRADTALAAAVLDLQQRLAVIDPGLQNPLAPEHVVDSFLQSLAETRLDIHTKMLMVRMFEAQLYARLERYVCLFNDELIALDVLPVLATRPGELEASINALVDEVMGQGTDHAFDSEARLVSAALADLQASYVEDIDSMLGVGAILTVVAAPPVRDLVGELRQHKLLPEAVSPAMQLQLDKIVMVGKLFRYLVDDHNLPIEARALLVNLQLPYARIALADAALLNSSRHPARALLNEITAVCAEWQPGGQALAVDELFLRLQATVQLFLEAERIETINYQQLLFEYLAFAEGQRQSSLTVTRRIMDSQIGAEVADTVREAVNKILLKRTGHARLPGAVRRIIDEGWSHVLYMTALQKGLAAAEWELALQVVDRLLCSVQPATAFASRSVFILQLPSLLRELRKGLQFINASPIIINQLLADLEEVHKQIVRDIPGDFTDLEKVIQYKHEPELCMEMEESASMPQAEYAVRSAIVFSAEELQELAVEAVETVKAGALDIFSARTLEVVAALGPGVSLLWHRDGVQVRCRVAAHIKHTKKFIITDRSGLKLAELSEYDMMQKIDSGEMEIMVSEQLFDRALESVIGNIRDLR